MRNIISSDSVLWYILSPQLRKMSLFQKVIFICEVCFSENSIHTSLISSRNNHIKWLEPNSFGRLRIRYVYNSGRTISHYIYDIISDIQNLHYNSRNAVYITMCTFPISYKYISHWKCVICFFSDFTPVELTYEETQDNIDMPNTRCHIYKEFGCFTYSPRSKITRSELLVWLVTRNGS